MWKAPADVKGIIDYTHPDSGKVRANNIDISCPEYKGSWLEWFQLAGADAGFKAVLWHNQPRMFYIHQAVPGPSAARDAQPVHYLTLRMQWSYALLYPDVFSRDIVQWLEQRLKIADKHKQTHKPMLKKPSDPLNNLSFVPAGEDKFLESASGSSDIMGLDVPAWLID